MFATPMTEADRAQRALAALVAMAGLRGRPSDVLTQLLGRLCEASGADGIGFQRREGEELVYVASAGVLGDQTGARSRVGGSLGGVALVSRNVAISADTRLDPRVDRDICLRSGAASLVAVPVDVSGVPAGALVAGWREANRADDAAVNVLRAGAAVLESLLARHLLAARNEDPERLLAAAFQQAEHADVGHRANAEIDVLTGLINREPFETALKTSVAHWTPGQGSAVLFIDLDRFHRVNEAHGHAAGDAVLQRLAEVLRRCTRGHDVVTRLGDDDFAVLLNRLSDPELQAAVAAERIIDTVMADNLTNDELPRIQVRIGAALIDRAGMSADRVMEEAYDALHAEKSERG